MTRYPQWLSVGDYSQMTVDRHLFRGYCSQKVVKIALWVICRDDEKKGEGGGV